MQRRKIGIRTLKNETSRIVNEVRESETEYVVTKHGKPVAVLRPVREDESEDDHSARVEKVMGMIHASASEVAKLSSGESAVSVVSRQRR